MRHKKLFTKNSTKLFLLGFLGLVFALAYLFWGLNSGNWDYNFPRRLKKIATVILVGYATGHSTLLFQTVTNNHVLTPSIMGLDSLYLFLQTVVVFLFGSSKLVMMNDLPSFFISLGLMVGASLVLFGLLFRGKEKNVYFLVLVGTVFGSLFGGLSSFMQMLIDPNEFAVLQGKMFASFNRINTGFLWISTIIVLLTLLFTVGDLKYLDVLSLGKNHAINLGVNYFTLALKSLIVVSILTSVTTVLVGPVSFLGILVISITRSLFHTFKNTILLPAVFIVNSTVLFFGMLITERIFNFSVPLSVVVNFAGGVYFIYLLIRDAGGRTKTQKPKPLQKAA